MNKIDRFFIKIGEIVTNLFLGTCELMGSIAWNFSHKVYYERHDKRKI